MSERCSGCVKETKVLTENENLARLEGTLKLVDKVIVPRHWLSDAVRCSPCWLWSVGVSCLDHDANRLESVGDDLALRRTNNV
jgi:chloramphenicol 3-O-phosphotransferase